jgi:hypothetical protein
VTAIEKFADARRFCLDFGPKSGCGVIKNRWRGRLGLARSQKESAVSAATPSSVSASRRRGAKGPVRVIEFGRRAVMAMDAGVPGYARYVGRVGALAVALGVGAAVASVSRM